MSTLTTDRSYYLSTLAANRSYRLARKTRSKPSLYSCRRSSNWLSTSAANRAIVSLLSPPIEATVSLLLPPIEQLALYFRRQSSYRLSTLAADRSYRLSTLAADRATISLFSLPIEATVSHSCRRSKLSSLCSHCRSKLPSLYTRRSSASYDQ